MPYNKKIIYLAHKSVHQELGQGTEEMAHLCSCLKVLAGMTPKLGAPTTSPTPCLSLCTQPVHIASLSILKA